MKTTKILGEMTKVGILSISMLLCASFAIAQVHGTLKYGVFTTGYVGDEYTPSQVTQRAKETAEELTTETDSVYTVAEKHSSKEEDIIRIARNYVYDDFEVGVGETYWVMITSALGTGMSLLKSEDEQTQELLKALNYYVYIRISEVGKEDYVKLIKKR